MLDLLIQILGKACLIALMCTALVILGAIILAVVVSMIDSIHKTKLQNEALREAFEKIKEIDNKKNKKNT